MIGTAMFNRTQLDPDPFRQFQLWYQTAQSVEETYVDAMALATANALGQPSVRMVLLRGTDEAGFHFFSHYDSRKGRELEENPFAALAFYWYRSQRQVRLTGKVVQLPNESSDRYWHSRPRGSQLGAWASQQSRRVVDRKAIDERLQQAERRFADGPVPRPPDWGGYRLEPESFEFWQGQPDRLHDRFLYSLRADGGWQIDRLSP